MTIKPDKPLQVGDWQYLPEQDKLVQLGADGKIAVTADLDNLSQKVANYFIVNAGRLITKDELLADVWGIRDVSDGRVTRVIRVLRVALGDDTREPSYIETIPKRGYRFVAPVTAIQLPEKSGVQQADIIDIAQNDSKPRRYWLPITAFASVFIAAMFWLLVPDDAATSDADVIPMLRYKPLTALDGLEFYHNVSPDERYMVYSYASPENEIVTVLMLEDLIQHKRVALTDDSYSSLGAAFSPDGKAIAYQRLIINELCEIRLIQLQSDLISVKSDDLLSTCGKRSISARLSWSADGNYLVYPEMQDGDKQLTLSVLSVNSGTTEKLTVPPASSFGDYSARYSRKGDKVAFLREAAGVAQIWVIDLTTRASKLLAKVVDAYPGNIDWDLQDQHIIFPSSATSISKVSLDGEVSVIAHTDNSASEIQITRSGNLVASIGNFSRINLKKISNSLVNAEQSNEPVFSSNRNETLIEANPKLDGPLAVVSRRSGLPQVWLMYPDKTQKQLTHFSERERIRSLVFSPDGTQLLVHANQQIFLYAFDGTYKKVAGSEAVLLGLPSWSRDGKTIYFAEVLQGKWRIVELNTQDLESRNITAVEREFYYQSYTADYAFWRESNTNKFYLQRAGQQPEELAISLPDTQVITKFHLAANGIYYSKLMDEMNYALHYYDLNSKTEQVVVDKMSLGRFSISADEKYVYILEYELADIDIGILEQLVDSL